MFDTQDEAESTTERTSSFVIFQFGGERYALEVGRVREVIDLGNLTAVPGGPAWLRGVINLRGHVVPVWDLRAPFDLKSDPDPAASSTPCVLIVESTAGTEIRVDGILVERVSDVLDFAPTDIQPSPTLGLGQASAFVRGLIRYHEGFLLVLDVDRVFAALGTSLGPGGI